MRRLWVQRGQVDLWERRLLTTDGQTVGLSRRETDLLVGLASRIGRIVPREELLPEVFGYSPEARTRVTDDTMKRLRAKIELDSRSPDHLLGVRGVGYGFRHAPSSPVPLGLGTWLAAEGSAVIDQDGAALMDLSPRESAVLASLALARGVVARVELAEITGCDSDGRAIDHLLCRLRNKLESHLGSDLLVTVRGKGLRLGPPRNEVRPPAPPSVGQRGVGTGRVSGAPSAPCTSGRSMSRRPRRP